MIQANQPGFLDRYEEVTTNLLGLLYLLRI